MASAGFDTWGFVASIIGVIFLVPIVCGWVADMMPSAKMRNLDAVLSETEAFLRSALEEGTIDYAYYDRNFSDRIWAAKVRADACRVQVYNIRNLWHEVRLWFGGLSGTITRVIATLTKIQGQIVTSSARGREQLEKQGCTTNPTLLTYSRRDRVESLTLPDMPPRTAASVECVAEEDNGACAISVAPTPCAPPRRSLLASLPAIPHATDDLAHTSAPHTPVEAGLGKKSEALPPLVYPSPPQLNGTGSIRHAMATASSILRRSGKAVPERHGFAGPFRILSGLFRRASDPIPATETLSSSAPLPPPPYTVSEKATCLHTTQLEDSGHVLVQLHLTV